MMRSLFSGVAGLRTHQTKMDVIGNNIANVNTTAYKAQSVTFRDLMYQTTQRASGGNAETGLGGVNAKQIGLGVTTGAFNTAITQQGSAQTTNNAFDIMITGDSFFVVNNGVENFFTRDGSFYVDGNGNLAMTSTGYNVMGWAVDPTTGEPKPDTVTALQVMNDANLRYPPEATNQARVTGNIDKFDTKVHSSSGRIINLEFFDSMGYKYTARMSIHAASAEGQFYVQLDDILDSTGKSVGEEMMNRVTFGSSSLTVDTSVAYTPVNGKVTTEGTVTITNSAATPATDFTVTSGAANGAPTADQQTILQAAYGGGLDFTGVTGFSISNAGVLTLTTATGSTTHNLTNSAAFAYSAETVIVTDKNDSTISQRFPIGTELTAADNAAMVQTLYGLDMAEAGTLAYEVGADGTLTVKRQNVKNAANLVYSTANGDFVSVNGNGAGTMVLGFGGIDKFSDITIDFSSSQSVNTNGASTVGATRGTSEGLGAGRKVGELTDIAVGKDGIITASYDNGMSKILGQIATANFANASGLEKQGDNLYSATSNSGEFDGIGKDITENSGYMSQGVLEMSNVDLSQEFTEMITTQRGFQANSRIITVSDTMLEELTNLKR